MLQIRTFYPPRALSSSQTAFLCLFARCLHLCLASSLSLPFNLCSSATVGSSRAFISSFRSFLLFHASHPASAHLSFFLPVYTLDGRCWHELARVQHGSLAKSLSSFQEPWCQPRWPPRSPRLSASLLSRWLAADRVAKVISVGNRQHVRCFAFPKNSRIYAFDTNAFCRKLSAGDRCPRRWCSTAPVLLPTSSSRAYSLGQSY